MDFNNLKDISGQQVVKMVRRFKVNNPVILTLCHESDFTEEAFYSPTPISSSKCGRYFEYEVDEINEKGIEEKVVVYCQKPRIKKEEEKEESMMGVQ